MTHISQKEVPKEVLKRITNQFFQLVQKQKSSFIKNLLTETEKIMIAKRLAVILMLLEDISYYKISKVLNVSVSTTRRLHGNLLSGEYEEIEKWFLQKKNRDMFWQDLSKIVHLGLPSYTGKRWSSLRKK